MKTKQFHIGRAAIVIAALLLFATVLSLTSSAVAPGWATNGTLVRIHYSTNLDDTYGKDITANFSVSATQNALGFSRSGSHTMHDYTALGPGVSYGSGTQGTDFLYCFCIQPGVGFAENVQTIPQYSAGDPNLAEIAYRNLGDTFGERWNGPASQRMLNLVLQYGYFGPKTVYSESEDRAYLGYYGEDAKLANCLYAATQLLVWQCMYGWRTNSAYDINDLSVGADGTTMTAQYRGYPGVNYYYEKILDAIREWEAMPDFGGDSFRLTYNSAQGWYECRITDSTGALASGNISYPSSVGGLWIRQGNSANELLITSGTPDLGSDNTVTFSKGGLPEGSSGEHRS